MGQRRGLPSNSFTAISSSDAFDPVTPRSIGATDTGDEAIGTCARCRGRKASAAEQMLSAAVATSRHGGMKDAWLAIT